MRQNTRLKFNQMCDKLAASYGVPSMNVQFAVEPTLQQRLQDKIVEQSTFLPKINIVPVDELAGENVLGSASGPVSGRSDTTKDSVERVPRDVLGLVSYKYQLRQTNSDVFMRYATMDAWAKFPDMAERYARYVQARIANDRELVGWYGTSAADTTDLSSNPLLQDVNKGWLQYIRDAIPQNILAEGETTGELRIGSEDGADWANLDVAVNDLVQGIPTYMRTGLVALIGTELIARDGPHAHGKGGDQFRLGFVRWPAVGKPLELPGPWPCRHQLRQLVDLCAGRKLAASYPRQPQERPRGRLQLPQRRICR